MKRWSLLVGTLFVVGCSDAAMLVEAPKPAAVQQIAIATSAPTRVVPTATPAPSATPAPPTETPVPQPPRVGIQVGHWQTEDLPDDLAKFRTSTGAFVNGITESDVNLPVAEQVKALLEAEGITVDLLPATVPVAYKADAFISIHADGSTSTSSRGFKMATPWRASEASLLLLDSLVSEYAAGTDMPQDSAITANMRGYYAFSWRRHRNAIAPTTPAVIVEMGFLTNSTDRAFMLNQSDVIAQSIANGLLRYLEVRDPNDLEALRVIEYAIQRPKTADVTVHSAPDVESRVLHTLEEDQRFMPFRQRDGWYEGFVRGSSNIVGWVQVSAMQGTSDQLPPPTDR